MNSRLFSIAASALLGAAAHNVSADEVKTDLYTVVDGSKVDAETLKGFRAWRQANCAACHGANQEGLAGPSLIERMTALDKEQFVLVVRDGRLERGMPPHADRETVMSNINQMYAYLKGRANGDIKIARVTAIE